jgi:hypothetical protein
MKVKRTTTESITILTNDEISVCATKAMREMGLHKNKDWIVDMGRKMEQEIIRAIKADPTVLVLDSGRSGKE